MSDFMFEKVGESGLYAVFHQDAGQGFFFLYRSELNEVLVQAQVYEHEPNPPLTEDDVEISWPTATDACLSVRGKKICRINVTNMVAECGLKGDNATELLRRDCDTSEAFQMRFKQERQHYWKEKADK
jgi:hypothetical protein